MNTSLEEKQATNIFIIIVLGNYIWSFKCSYAINTKLHIYIYQNASHFLKYGGIYLQVSEVKHF